MKGIEGEKLGVPSKLWTTRVYHGAGVVEAEAWARDWVDAAETAVRMLDQRGHEMALGSRRVQVAVCELGSGLDSGIVCIVEARVRADYTVVRQVLDASEAVA